MEASELTQTLGAPVILVTQQEKTWITKLFDRVDGIDRKLYGKKLKYFIRFSLAVLILAPLLDGLFKDRKDIITFISTFCFLIFIVIVTLAWISSWRDDNGNWTFRRAISRLKTYYQILADTANRTRTNSKDETLYKIGLVFFVGSLCWKSMQNLSVFVRKPIEGLFSTRLEHLRRFEQFTNFYWWFLFAIGIGLLFYLYRQNAQILKRIEKDFFSLLSNKYTLESKYGTALVKMEALPERGYVINTRQSDQVLALTSTNDSPLFRDFINALQNWKPHTSSSEGEYQDKLLRHLSRSMPDAVIDSEYPVGEKYDGTNGRADIVINDTILVEMKKDSSGTAMDRAKGQIDKYSIAWKDRGPIILLLCDYDYERAKAVFTPVMENFARQQKPVLTIVAKPL
jgi:hypothetical protein